MCFLLLKVEKKPHTVGYYVELYASPNEEVSYRLTDLLGTYASLLEELNVKKQDVKIASNAVFESLASVSFLIKDLPFIGFVTALGLKMADLQFLNCRAFFENVGAREQRYIVDSLGFQRVSTDGFYARKTAITAEHLEKQEEFNPVGF